MMSALLEAAPPRRLNPATEMTSVTPSTSRTSSLARSTAALGPGQRGAGRQLHVDEERALVLQRQEAGRGRPDRNTAPPAKAAKSSIEIPERRISRPTSPA